MESYSALAASYDELTQDVGYEKRAAFVEKLFLRSHIPVHTVLDLACGTGTMTALLTERGYELIGVDGSEDMLLEAREKAQTLTGVPPLFLHQPQTMMASEREIVQEAYAGDIIGVFDPGIFSIGDTITVPGKKFRFGGIPTFEPEHFMSVSPKDTMKRKQFVKGIEQIAQEGAIQIFKMPDSGFEDVVVGVVGTLQFDVFEYRMKSEYGVELRMSALPYEHLRLIAECPGDPKDLMFCTGSKLLEDFKGRKLIAFGGEWSVGFLTKHNPGLVLDDWLTVSK